MSETEQRKTIQQRVRVADEEIINVALALAAGRTPNEMRFDDEGRGDSLAEVCEQWTEQQRVPADVVGDPGVYRKIELYLTDDEYEAVLDVVGTVEVPEACIDHSTQRHVGYAVANICIHREEDRKDAIAEAHLLAQKNASGQQSGLRDLLASNALSAAQEWHADDDVQKITDIANTAYEIADAMLEARANSNERR